MLFHNKRFKVDNEYMTPKTAWENISHVIPKNKIIWESAYGDGESGKYFKDMGYNVYHEPLDYFTEEPAKWDIQITNPPFSKKKEWFTRAKEFNKPFIILCPSSMICTQYIRKLFNGEKLQIIIPRKRIQFIKKID